MPIDLKTLSLLTPELALVVFGTIVMVGSTFLRSRSTWIWTAVGGFLLACLALSQQRGWVLPIESSTAGPLIVDSLGGTMRVLSGLLGLLFLLAIARNAATSQIGELLGMVMFVFAGLMLTCWAGNLVTLFLALELISVPTYVLLFLGGQTRGASESTAKYFFLSILSSAFFLLGMALLFGVTGSTELTAIEQYFQSVGKGGGPAVRLVSVAFVFLFAGLGFKITAVPFHFYAPDVYQSTSNANAGLLAVVPKIAGIVVIVRLLVAMLPAELSFGWQMAVAVSLLTMTIGNVCALWQNNIRRMMAYSSIAHGGYMLIGLAVAFTGIGSQSVYSGLSATLLYLVMYAVASLGTFAVLCEVSGDDEANDVRLVRHLAGLGKQRPWMAGALAVFMFSLAGIPPLAGFWGKMTLFTSALATARESDALGGGASWFLVLAIVGVINAAIAAAYYLRIVGVAYFAEPTSEDLKAPLLLPNFGTAACSAIFCALALVIAGVMPGAAVNQFRDMGTGTTSQQISGPSPAPGVDAVAPAAWNSDPALRQRGVTSSVDPLLLRPR